VQKISPFFALHVSGAVLTFTQPDKSFPLKSGVNPSAVAGLTAAVWSRVATSFFATLNGAASVEIVAVCAGAEATSTSATSKATAPKKPSEYVCM
jgi:hypothetical protein